MATVEISEIELLALKKLALINNALATSLRDRSARQEQTALLRVLMDVIGRAALAQSAAPVQPEDTGRDDLHRELDRTAGYAPVQQAAPSGEGE